MHRPPVSFATRLLAALGVGLPSVTMHNPSISGGFRKRSAVSVKAGQRAAAKRRNINRNRNAHKRASCK